MNTALNKLIPELGLDGILAPVDVALGALLTGLNGILPGVLSLVGAMSVAFNAPRRVAVILTSLPLA